MTMLTRCAACGSTFRITPEQLAVRRGTVRCGTCGEVFSAILGLARASHAHAPVEPAGDAGAESPQAGSRVSTLVSTPELTTTEVALGTPQATQMGTLTAASVEDEIPAAPDALAQFPDGGTISRNASRPWGSLAGAVVAVVALVFQAAYFYRNEAVVHFPETKPWLQSMCVHLSCRFDAPREAQAISIESHDLQADPVNKNLLALIALLRNRAGFAQDAPHLELTLTDALDAPITRRVLAPRDYFAGAPMGAGAELQIRLSIDAGQVRASGYRLYAFYP